MSVPTRWKKLSRTRRNSPNCKHKCALVGKELLTERRWFIERLQQMIKTSVLLKESLVLKKWVCSWTKEQWSTLVILKFRRRWPRTLWPLQAMLRQSSWRQCCPGSSTSWAQTVWLAEEDWLELCRTVCGWKSPTRYRRGGGGSSRSCGQFWWSFQGWSKLNWVKFWRR